MTSSQNAIRLNSLFSEGVVLQVGASIPLAGSCRPHRPVSVALGDQVHETVSDGNGCWQVVLSPVQAYGPACLKIVVDVEVVNREVLFGEVWLASGQSNMMWPLEESLGGRQESVVADDPLMRFFIVPERVTKVSVDELGGAWVAIQPNVAARFSGIAYYFAKILRQSRNCPIGIIQAAIGGTLISSWKSEATLEADPQTKEYWTAYKKAVSTYGSRFQEWQKDPSGLKPPPPERILPAGYFNGMIAPLIDFPVRGVIWYQGEGNNKNADHYERELTELIGEWRRLWKQSAMPFYFVQLAGYAGEPWTNHTWPFLRDAQLATWRHVARTGMAVSIDVGARDNIHPPDKATVGDRLARWARHDGYGEALTPSGPLFRSADRDGNRLRVVFDYADKGLVASDGKQEVAGFELSGIEGVYHPALAIIDGRDVVVHSEAVPAPVHVRYAWSGCPTVTLQNTEGLPAVPFRTDKAPFVAQY